MKKIFFLAIFSLSLYVALGQTPRLSPNAQVSLLTCAPGSDLYSTFGHSALRIQDPINAIDLVYNYGTFDFQQDNFYVKFVRGRLNYTISLAYYDRFMYEYRDSKRAVVEQILNISPEQKQKVFEFLEWNHRPENKNYLYDFFFDNCATRFRDLFPKVLGAKNIKYDQTIEKNHQTFRDLLDLYLEKSPWEHIGINIILGAPTDQVMTADNYMFLPDYLHDAFAKAVVVDSLGHSHSLAGPDRAAYKPEAVPEDAHGPITPTVLVYFLLVVFILLTYLDCYKKYYNRFLALLDPIFFFTLGLLGALIVFLWFFTDHKVVVRNWNIAWALPIHLVSAFWYARRKIPTFVRVLLLSVSVVSVLLLVFWKILPQRLDLNLIPVLIVVAMRGYTLYKYRR